MSNIYSSIVRSLPFTYALLFIVIAALTVFLLYKSIGAEKKFRRNSLYLLGSWILVISLLSIEGAYSNFAAFPPRLFIMGVIPATLIVLYLVFLCNDFLRSLSVTALTWVHVVRIPVELGLLLLFTAGAVPEVMTFEGRNLDILSGISAVIMAILSSKERVSRKALIIWNFIGLGLLINIVTHAILAAPFPGMQRIAFDQPNIAVFYFPFSFLPVFIVPAVLFAHLAALRKLLSRQV